MSNSELLQKVFDKVGEMEEKSENLDRTTALFDVRLKIIDIALEEGLHLKVSNRKFSEPLCKAEDRGFGPAPTLDEIVGNM